MTRTAPWRRMILHFSHIGFTDGPTLYGSLSSLFRRASSGGRYGRRYRSGSALGATTHCSTGAGPRQALRSGRGGPRAELVPGREDARAVRRDGHRELEVGGQRAVLRVDRPVVLGDPDGVPAGGDHGLDREDHALLEDDAGVGPAVVRDLRGLVQTG